MMKDHELLASVMRKTLRDAGLSEVSADGEFKVGVENTKLFPGAVYGFAVRLEETEKAALFQEALDRGLARIEIMTAFMPIEGNLYPIYWGKDKQLGARPYQHLSNPSGTGSIRLSTYDSLKGKVISCAVVVVNNYDDAEEQLQTAFPDLLKTTTQQVNEVASLS